jgi:catechol 2,3-dioxygenase-like lactoylglutathione lyase family enzyme
MATGLGPLDLVTIQVRNWTAAVQWYTEVLGLPIVTSDEDDGFCMLGTDGAALALASDHLDQAVGTEQNRLAPAFRVADLDGTLDRLRSLGVKVDPHIDGEDEGYRLARIYDPEGNRLHLYCYG